MPDINRRRIDHDDAFGILEKRQEIQAEKMLDKNAHFLREALLVLRTRQTAELEEALAGTASFLIETLKLVALAAELLASS